MKFNLPPGPTASPTKAPAGGATSTPTAAPTSTPLPPGTPTAAPTAAPTAVPTQGGGGLPGWLRVVLVVAAGVAVIGCVLGWWHWCHRRDAGWMFANELKEAFSPRSGTAAP